MSNKVEWIDVRERLPEKPLDLLSAKEYLVTIKCDNEPGDVTTLYFIDKDNW